MQAWKIEEHQQELFDAIMKKDEKTVKSYIRGYKDEGIMYAGHYIGKDSMCLSIENGLFDAAEFILKEGYDVKEGDLGEWFCTYLQENVDELTEEHRHFAKVLLDAGVDLTSSDTIMKEGICYLDYDIRKELCQIIATHEAEKEGKPVPQINKWDEVLLEAAWFGDDEKVCKALEFAANINVTDGLGMTPLHLTMFADAAGLEPETLQKLIDKGANVNAIDNFGFTPLDRFCLELDSENYFTERNAEVARVLLRNGAKIERDHSYYETVFELCLGEHVAELKKIAQEVEAEKKNGQTPAVIVKGCLPVSTRMNGGKQNTGGIG